jgi:hypothetical protein
MKRCHLDQLWDDHPEKLLDTTWVYNKNWAANNPDSPSTGTGSDSDSNSPLRRAVIEDDNYPFFEIPMISVPPGEKWPGRWDTVDKDYHEMSYEADDSFGAGQTIFVLEDDWSAGSDEFTSSHTIKGSNTVLTRPPFELLPAFDWGDEFTGPPATRHGTVVLSKVAGWQLGLAKRAKIYVVADHSGLPDDDYNELQERHFEVWVRTLNEVRALYARDPSQRGKVIVTSATGWHDYQTVIPNPMMIRMRK